MPAKPIPALKKNPGRLPAEARSACPIGNTLDLLGDRWTLLVIRDMLFMEKRLFGELLVSDEKIHTNLLAERLKRLEEHGIVTKKAYQKNPVRYEYHLTQRGKDLLPVLKEIMLWADRHLPGVNRAPEGFFEALKKG